MKVILAAFLACYTVGVNSFETSQGPCPTLPAIPNFNRARVSLMKCFKTLRSFKPCIWLYRIPRSTQEHGTRSDEPQSLLKLEPVVLLLMLASIPMVRSISVSWRETIREYQMTSEGLTSLNGNFCRLLHRTGGFFDNTIVAAPTNQNNVFTLNVLNNEGKTTVRIDDLLTLNFNRRSTFYSQHYRHWLWYLRCYHGL